MAFTLGRVKGTGGDALTAAMTTSVYPNDDAVSDSLIFQRNLSSPIFT